MQYTKTVKLWDTVEKYKKQRLNKMGESQIKMLELMIPADSTVTFTCTQTLDTDKIETQKEILDNMVDAMANAIWRKAVSGIIYAMEELRK